MLILSFIQTNYTYHTWRCGAKVAVHLTWQPLLSCPISLINNLGQPRLSSKHFTGVGSLTHSLLCLTSEGRSDLQNEWSCADDHSESIVHPWSSSTCYIQVFPGRPGGRFQSGAGHLPCDRLTQCWRILWAGTSGGRRQTCPSSESLLSAMMRGRSVSFVWLRTESLVTKSYHFMFRMRRCVFMWKACSLAVSALVRVHVSDPCSKTDWTRDV